MLMTDGKEEINYDESLLEWPDFNKITATDSKFLVDTVLDLLIGEYREGKIRPEQYANLTACCISIFQETVVELLNKEWITFGSTVVLALTKAYQDDIIKEPFAYADTMYRILESNFTMYCDKYYDTLSDQQITLVFEAIFNYQENIEDKEFKSLVSYMNKILINDYEMDEDVRNENKEIFKKLNITKETIEELKRPLIPTKIRERITMIVETPKFEQIKLNI